MPVLPNLEAFPYEEQESGTLTCVPDCVSIIYQFLGIDQTWASIAGELRYSEMDGTPFENIEDLSEVAPILVECLDDAEVHLGLCRPVLVNVRVSGTALFTYARTEFLHAVVPVGCTEDEVVLVDPLAMARLGAPDPIRGPRRALEQAWESAYVLLSL